MMNATMELLPMTGWALIGAFALVVLLALAIIFFLRGLAMLRKAEEIAPHMMALKALKADIAKAEAEKDNLRSEVENAKDTIARADTAKQYIKNHEPLVESMRREEELLKTHLEMAKDRLQKASETCSDLEDKNNKLYKQLTDQQQALDFLEARHREVQAETDRLQSNKEQLEAAIETLSKKRHIIELAIASLAAKQAELERLDREIERLRAQHYTLTEQTNALETKRDELNASIRKLVAQEDEAKARCQQVQTKLNDVNNELNKLRKEQEELLAKRIELNELISKKELMEKEVKEWQDKANNLHKQAMDFQQSLDFLEARHSEVQKDIRRLEDGKKQLETSNAMLSQERQKIEMAIASLAAKQAELERLDLEIERLEKDIKGTEEKLETLKTQSTALDAEVAEKQGKCNALTRQVAELGTIDKNAKDAWQDLDRPAAPIVQRSAERQDHAEADWLDGLDKLLRDFKFKFPKRTLKAFHTSLKCGEESPLVVLAGISGTGKSLLPELYAAAAGMNFISVPVQPRWDSPQDLLGFYNYMEGRYKATELARFLWQADRWNNPTGTYAFPKDSLNIVLLDEMNLARVEYYFADFLSKLEIRKDTRQQWEESSRRNAELTLECGAGLSPRRLFLDFNTFFIGTMNEDETTQMLSDKVIDRSNLLRFGRPQDTQAHPDKGEFLKECNKRPKVTGALWEKWARPKALHQQDYQPLLKELNDALDNVGRPFAYRVQQSIDAYMAAYPDQNDWRVAFADQIEMKVLPKLNGLEIASSPKFTETASTIQKIAKELDDEELQEEFERASNVENTFFRWRGVMRKDTSEK